jgi:glycosyltransferase involved in cell wall biosynthesis
MDYLVKEIASIPGPRPFLVMLGQRDQETPFVLEIADQSLGSTEYICRNVPMAETRDYYQVADVFALASLKEGFGRVLAEALSHGLACLAASQPFAREVLGRNGYLADFSRPGELAILLKRVLAHESSPELAASRHADAYDRLSWDRLRPKYAEMIVRCARNEAAPPPGQLTVGNRLIAGKGARSSWAT